MLSIFAASSAADNCLATRADSASCALAPVEGASAKMTARHAPAMALIVSSLVAGRKGRHSQEAGGSSCDLQEGSSAGVYRRHDPCAPRHERGDQRERRHRGAAFEHFHLHVCLLNPGAFYYQEREAE